MTESESQLFHNEWKDLPELIHDSKDLIAIFDENYCLTAANDAYCKAFYCNPNTRTSWPDIMRSNYLCKRGPVVETNDIEAWLVEALARRSTRTYRSFEAELHGGKWIWITEVVSRKGMTLFYATDISTVRASLRKIRLERDTARRASWTDPLTGVPNRRYIMDRLEEWHESQSSQAKFGEHVLAVVDLDYFKRINDIYGHDVGDEVLCSFCQNAIKNIRPFDVFGRIGGEEFLFLMPNCSPEVALLRLSLLQSMTLIPKHCPEGKAITYTFSGGWYAFIKIKIFITRSGTPTSYFIVPKQRAGFAFFANRKLVFLRLLYIQQALLLSRYALVKVDILQRCRWVGMARVKENYA